MSLTRRRALLAGAALPFAGLAHPLAAQEDHGAAAPGVELPTHQAFRLGEAKMVVLPVATFPLERPQEVFGLDVDAETFARVSAENFIPADRGLLFVQPMLLDAGGARVLFDTGLEAEGLLRALEAAGYGAGDVTDVVLTHMHPDHVGGLMNGGGPTFANAAHHAGRVEFDHWAAQSDEAFEANVRPLADRLRFMAGDDRPVPGVTAVESFGHTPGHLCFRVESGDQAILVLGDVVHHPVWSVGHPDWEMAFDEDKVAAKATRRRVLEMLAAERMAAQGVHLPFPSLGFVEERGEGFRWVPASTQFM